MMWNYKRIVMKKIVYTLIFIFVAIWACSDDEEVHYASVATSPAEDFIDSRDGKVYKCIEIGNQIWLAENLAYNYINNGSNADCRSFGEGYVAIELDSIKIPENTLIETLLADIASGEIEDYDAGLMMASELIEMYVSMAFPFDVIVQTCEGSGWTRFIDAFARYEVELPAGIAADSLNNVRTDIEAENGHYSETYGYLYSYDGALAAVPEEGGWRIPTEEDWANLERYLGMDESEIAKENTWRGTTEGALLKAEEHGIGFNALYAGGKMYAPTYSSWTDGDLYTREGQNAYFWSAEKIADTDTTSLGVIRSVAVFSEQILKTTTRIENEDGQPVLFSVRLVKDK